MLLTRSAVFVSLFVLCSALSAIAQTGAPAPATPDAGRQTIHATRLTEPIKVDGRLDEGLYSRVAPSSGFVQSEPMPGAPANERTDVWVTFDENAVYVSFRVWESEPDKLIAKEMRRDSANITQNDSVAFVLDTFNDRRNGVIFTMTPIGGRMDGQISNESNYNGDWNPVWLVKPGRFDGGWTLETRIPFKSLRYRESGPVIWGINFRRVVRWKNEHVTVGPLPAAFGSTGLGQMQAEFDAMLTPGHHF